MSIRTLPLLAMLLWPGPVAFAQAPPPTPDGDVLKMAMEATYPLPVALTFGFLQIVVVLGVIAVALILPTRPHTEAT